MRDERRRRKDSVVAAKSRASYAVPASVRSCRSTRADCDVHARGRGRDRMIARDSRRLACRPGEAREGTRGRAVLSRNCEETQRAQTGHRRGRHGLHRCQQRAASTDVQAEAYEGSKRRKQNRSSRIRAVAVRAKVREGAPSRALPAGGSHAHSHRRQASIHAASERHEKTR